MPTYADPTSMWSRIGVDLLFMSPVILVQCVGVIIALVLIRGRVGPAVCVALALTASFVFLVLSIITVHLVQSRMLLGEMDYDQARLAHSASRIVASLVHAGALTLLIIAALGWRQGPRTT